MKVYVVTRYWDNDESYPEDFESYEEVFKVFESIDALKRYFDHEITSKDILKDLGESFYVDAVESSEEDWPLKSVQYYCTSTKVPVINGKPYSWRDHCNVIFKATEMEVEE